MAEITFDEKIVTLKVALAYPELVEQPHVDALVGAIGKVDLNEAIRRAVDEAIYADRLVAINLINLHEKYGDDFELKIEVQ